MTPAGTASYITKGKWALAPHLSILNHKLMEAASGRIRKLMVTMPPRHGKSMLTSQYFPAWYIGTMKSKRVILASYEADFAAGWGRKVRDTLAEHGKEIFNVEINNNSSAAFRWDLKGFKGGMDTAGVGGPMTGKGADLLIIDDPVKNNEQAMSASYREKMFDWYRSTALTRLEPGGSVIIIQTRWHEDDLAGRCMTESLADGEPWDVIDFPAIATAEDKLGRKVGDALWPARFDVDALATIQKEIGSYWWNALYQQKPQPPGGSIFKSAWFRYFFDGADSNGIFYELRQVDEKGAFIGTKRVYADKCWKFQTVDLAAKESQKNDYCAIGTYAVTPDKDILILDTIQEKAETTKHMPLMEQSYAKWKPSFVGVEDQSYGTNLIQAMKKNGYPARELKADRDKTARARVVAARYELGTVYHRVGAPYLTALEAELLAFPTGKHDDLVDITAYAGITLTERREPRIRSL